MLGATRENLHTSLEVLRKAQGPLTAREITERPLAARDITDASPKAVRSLIASVQTSLQNHDGETVAKSGKAYRIDGLSPDSFGCYRSVKFFAAICLKPGRSFPNWNKSGMRQT
jgi:hypothetical protein